MTNIPTSRITVAPARASTPTWSGSSVPYVPSSPTSIRTSATMIVRAVGA
ncbi:MAG TPA: hypothetical protein VIK13_17295 [Candidatus Limnocylindrales bacterium]